MLVTFQTTGDDGEPQGEISLNPDLVAEVGESAVAGSSGPTCWLTMDRARAGFRVLGSRAGITERVNEASQACHSGSPLISLSTAMALEAVGFSSAEIKRAFNDLLYAEVRR